MEEVTPLAISTRRHGGHGAYTEKSDFSDRILKKRAVMRNMIIALHAALLIIELTIFQGKTSASLRWRWKALLATVCAFLTFDRRQLHSLALIEFLYEAAL